MNEADWKPLFESNDVNYALSYFTNIVSVIFDKHAPPLTKRIRGKKCQWMNNDIKDLMRKRDFHLKKARKTNKDDWSIYKRLRNCCNNMIKHAKSVIIKTRLKRMHPNLNNFGSVLKKSTPQKSIYVSVT